MVGIIINCAGEGSRFGEPTPKQYYEVLGKPIYIWCIEQFEQNPKVNKIYIVANEKYFDLIQQQTKLFGIKKFQYCVCGGGDANLSRMMGYNALKKEFRDDDIVVFHDAVRVTTKQSTIDKLIKQTKYLGACSTCYILNADNTIMYHDGLVLPSIELGYKTKGVMIFSMPLAIKKKNMDYCIQKYNEEEHKGKEFWNYAGLQLWIANACYKKFKLGYIQIDFAEQLKITIKEDLKIFEQLQK